MAGREILFRPHVETQVVVAENRIDPVPAVQSREYAHHPVVQLVRIDVDQIARVDDHIGMFAVDQGDHPPDQAAVPGLRSGVQVGEQGDAVAVESDGELVRAQCDPVDVYVRAAESSAPDQNEQRQGCGSQSDA